MYKTLRRHPLILKLGSLKVATVCLLLLSVLTFFGTLYQAEYGLFQAQEKFFYTWLFRWYFDVPFTQYRAWFPFPGALGICWVMTINLLVATVFRIVWTPKKIGVLFTHAGLILLLVGGGYTFYVAEESQVTLAEGKKTHFSQGYHEWEVSLWEGAPDGTSKKVYAFDLEGLQKSSTYEVPELETNFEVFDNQANALAYPQQPAIPGPPPVNASGIAMIKEQALEQEPEKNTPGLMINVNRKGKGYKVLLFGGEVLATQVDETLHMQVRRKRFPLPFEIELIDFQRKMHGGTGMAKAFKSTVLIRKEKEERRVLIEMNQPFRMDGYTMFQASFSQDMAGNELSTFATVKNPGHWVPYVSSLITGFGMLLHFMIQFIAYLKKRKPQEARS